MAEHSSILKITADFTFFRSLKSEEFLNGNPGAFPPYQHKKNHTPGAQNSGGHGEIRLELRN